MWLAAVSLTAPAAIAAALPSPGAQFEYQIGGPSVPDPGTAVVSRDWHDQPAAGLYSICYINAFQVQPEELAAWKRSRRGLLLRVRGRLVVDGNWNEVLVDTRTARKRTRLARITATAIASCAAKGFQAVEFDNLDSFTRSRGRIRVGHNIDLARRLVAIARGHGLAAAQKNTVELGARGRDVIGFDFAIAEECQVYDECDAYRGVYGSNVIEVEYTDNGMAAFNRACALRGGEISILLRDRGVVPRGDPDYVSRWC